MINWPLIILVASVVLLTFTYWWLRNKGDKGNSNIEEEGKI